MACAFQPVIVFRLESLVLCTSHLIDSFTEVLGHMELVVHQFGIRGLFRHGIGVRGKHVGRHGSDLVPLLRRKGLEDRFRRDLRPVLNDVQNARSIEICQHSDVVMAFSKAFFINPEMSNRRCLTPLQASLDCSVHDRLQGIPGEAKDRSSGFDVAAGLQDFDGESFEEEGESTMLSCPRRYDRLHAVLWATASRESGYELRCELHGVEVPPTSFVGMISEATCAATFGTGDPRADMLQVDFDSAILEPQVDRLNQPGVVGPQQSGVVGGKCFHPPNLSHHRSRIRQNVPRNSPKNESFIVRATIALMLAPVVMPTVSVAQVVYGNLGSSGTGALGGTNTDVDLTNWPAQGFSTGTSTDLNVQSITMGVFYDNSLTGPFTVSLYADASGQPAGTSFATSSATTIGTNALYTFPFTGLTLAPNTTYWTRPAVGLSWYRNQGETAPTAQNGSGYSYVGTSITADGGSTYGPVNAGYSISINAVPEPASVGLMALGAAGLGITALRRMRRD